MDEAKRKLGEVLKAKGYSLTKPRLVVFEHLVNREPVSLSSLTKAVAGVVDRASVYRTITLFLELGIIQRHNTGLKYKIELSDMFAEHHHHFTCLNCGKVIAMNERALERFVDRLSDHYHFTASAHQIEIQGYCSMCKATLL